MYDELLNGSEAPDLELFLYEPLGFGTEADRYTSYHQLPYAGSMLPNRSALLLAVLFATATISAHAQTSEKWVTTWTASVHGPYPLGNPSAQPDLHFAFPVPAAGARDQTFRLIVHPDLWGQRTRIRLSNVFGTKPVTCDGVFAGLQLSAGAIVAGTNQPVRFGGKPAITIAPGESVWSDPVTLPFVRRPVQLELAGRKLAISFHVAGESGLMTWHAKALTTSYLNGEERALKGSPPRRPHFPSPPRPGIFLMPST